VSWALRSSLWKENLVSSASKPTADKVNCSFLRQSLEGSQVEEMTLQEVFPHKRTSRVVAANALFHTCCLCRLTND